MLHAAFFIENQGPKCVASSDEINFPRLEFAVTVGVNEW